MKIIPYGPYFLLTAVAGEMIVPFLLAPFYEGYRHSTMAISSLGSAKSPVRILFRLWMLAAGVLLLLSLPGFYSAFHAASKPLCIAVTVCIALFAAGACILSCFFSVNESKDVHTPASRIHGAGSAIGFLLLLLVPLFLSILYFKVSDIRGSAIAGTSFALGLMSFALFVMADKPQFQDTAVAKEGLWQRLTLFFLYLPLAYWAVTQL